MDHAVKFSPFPLLLCAACLAASVTPSATTNRATRRFREKNPAFGGDDRFVSVTEAADYLGVTTRTIRNMLLDNRLRAYTLGPRTLRIRLSDLHAALAPYGGADAT